MKRNMLFILRSDFNSASVCCVSAAMLFLGSQRRWCVSSQRKINLLNFSLICESDSQLIAHESSSFTVLIICHYSCAVVNDILDLLILF